MVLHLTARFVRSAWLGKSFLSTSQVRCLKEIRYTEKDDITIIEGIQVKSPRQGKVLKEVSRTGACPLCKLGLKNLTHTDVLILSQFIYPNGEILPTMVTGLCDKQHQRVSHLVKQAQKANLLPSRADQVPNGPWDFNNTYFKTSYGR